VRLQKQEKEKKRRSAKPEKVLLYHSPTICSPNFSLMGGVVNLKMYYILLYQSLCPFLLCVKCPNALCELILDIYVPKTFQ